MSDIIFSITSDTANGLVEPTTLSNEIVASGLPQAQKIDTLGDVLTVSHSPDLTSPQSGTLTGVVAAHSGIDFSTVDHPGPDLHYTDAEAIAAASGALTLDGDVVGPLQSTIVSGIAGFPIESSVPATGQVLKFDGVQWELQPESPREALRSALTGTIIDFSDDEIRFKTLTTNTVFTIINPILGGMVIIELDGVFTVTLPGTVNVINGDYCPDLGTNFLYLFCTNMTPEYQASWTVVI